MKTLQQPNVAPCPNCEMEEVLRHREFSESTWVSLYLSGEINEATINRPICDTCYHELRQELIDRTATEQCLGNVVAMSPLQSNPSALAC